MPECFKSINSSRSLGVDADSSGLIVVQMYPAIPEEEKTDLQKMRILLTTDEAEWLVGTLMDVLEWPCV